MSPATPMSYQSGFEITLPEDSPVFESSPPVLQSDFGQRRSFKLRESLMSEAPTTNSDTDMHVFTDEESVDFHSDTNYDSLATRGTLASIRDSHQPKLETIFAERTSEETQPHNSPWRNMVQRTLFGDASTSNGAGTPQMHGIGIAISGLDINNDKFRLNGDSIATPPRSASFMTEDFNATPVPHRYQKHEMDASPLLLPKQQQTGDFEMLGQRLDKMELDDLDDLDWSPKSDATRARDSPDENTAPVLTASTLQAQQLIARFSEESELDGFVEEPPQKHIFDFSEHNINGMNARPKTVHGRQGQDLRSRSSGRKGASNMHMRSQSVPVAREGPVEEPTTGTKFPTWGLGTKPATETWEEDFDLDMDMKDAEPLGAIVNGQPTTKQESVKSVKVPQSIIDRQHSVHLQYGQVQEFMVLVEDLKRLRSTGTTLGLLNRNSKQLWEDAESIINLATINDDDIETPLPIDNDFPDPFADIPSIITTAAPHTSPPMRPRRPTNGNRRSVSNITTPPINGRTRGDSLAQAKHLLQNIHERRAGADSSLREIEIHQQKKMPFDTQDLKDLVTRSGVIMRALKEETEGSTLRESDLVQPHTRNADLFTMPSNSPTRATKKP
ncbi:hypothetical protein LTR66_015402 [Elasticomyces elasticus]|nr:hypothetical protein LTR66_015402 [Elasticomyces elasticus]